MLYVNDTKIICKNMHTILAFKENISTEFKISDMRPIDYYLDVKITQDRERRMLILFQENYMKKALILLEMNEATPASTLRIPSKYYEANEEEVFTEEFHKYLQLISNAMYEMTQTCPDYAIQISHLASFF